MNIIIFGATGGIGSAITSALSEKHNLFLAGRDSMKLDNLIESIKIKTSNKIEGSLVDASSFENVESFMKIASGRLEKIDAIINCVGSLILKPAHLTSEQELLETMKINLFSSFSIIKYGIKYLRNTGGSMIFFSSSAASVGLSNHEAIASAKGAIESLVTSAASTYAKYNIRFNSISPGLVKTNLTKRITENDVSYDYSRKLHALKRIGSPNNFIPIINCLLEQDSDWITGQNFKVDGGLSNLK